MISYLNKFIDKVISVLEEFKDSLHFCDCESCMCESTDTEEEEELFPEEDTPPQYL